MGKVLVTILVLVGTVSLYILSYVMNKRTPVPEGIVPLADCDACNTLSCAQHPENDKSVKDDMKEFIESNKNDDVIL